MEHQEIMRIAGELEKFQEQRKALEAEARRIEGLEKSLIQILIPEMRNMGANVFGDGKLSVFYEKKAKPKAADWDEIYKYIERTGSFELLHKRLMEKACEERRILGDPIPGVEWEEVESLKIKRIS